MRLSSYERMDFHGACWEIDMESVTTRSGWQCETKGESAILDVEDEINLGEGTEVWCYPNSVSRFGICELTRLREVSMNKVLAVFMSLLVLTGCGPSAKEKSEARLIEIEQRKESKRIELETLAKQFEAEVAPPTLSGLGALAVLNAQEFIQANPNKAYLIYAQLIEIYRANDGYRLIFEPGQLRIAELPNLLTYDVSVNLQQLEQIRSDPRMLKTYSLSQTAQIIVKLNDTSLLPIDAIQGNKDSAYAARRLVITGELIAIVKR